MQHKGGLNFFKMSINHAIIPAAGLGTRFLPITKVLPKAMIPIYNRPAISYIIEEALEADIKHLIFVVSPKQKI